MNEIQSWYLELSDGHKQIFLGLVSHQLTIYGRAVGLDLSGNHQIESLKGLNELHHQISGHIVATGLSAERYPDDVFWNILQEKAAAHQISALLSSSLQAARSSSCWAKRIQ